MQQIIKKVCDCLNRQSAVTRRNYCGTGSAATNFAVTQIGKLSVSELLQILDFGEGASTFSSFGGANVTPGASGSGHVPVMNITNNINVTGHGSAGRTAITLISSSLRDEPDKSRSFSLPELVSYIKEKIRPQASDDDDDADTVLDALARGLEDTFRLSSRPRE